MTNDLAEARDLPVRYGGDDFDCAFARAKQALAWDDQGREILDALVSARLDRLAPEAI